MDEECMSVHKTVEDSHTGFLGSGLGGFGWPVRNFDTELPGVLRVELRPTELHRLASNDAADGASAEKVIQNIETNVPPGSTNRDEAAIDVVPQRQARAANQRLRVSTGYRCQPS